MGAWSFLTKLKDSLWSIVSSFAYCIFQLWTARYLHMMASIKICIHRLRVFKDCQPVHLVTLVCVAQWMKIKLLISSLFCSSILPFHSIQAHSIHLVILRRLVILFHLSRLTRFVFLCLKMHYSKPISSHLYTSFLMDHYRPIVYFRLFNS